MIRSEIHNKLGKKLGKSGKMLTFADELRGSNQTFLKALLIDPLHVNVGDFSCLCFRAVWLNDIKVNNISA